MRGHLFGYKKLDPCRNCNTPQIGIDEDDDFTVVPGTVENGELVKLSGCEKCKPKMYGWI